MPITDPSVQRRYSTVWHSPAPATASRNGYRPSILNRPISALRAALR